MPKKKAATATPAATVDLNSPAFQIRGVGAEAATVAERLRPLSETILCEAESMPNDSRCTDQVHLAGWAIEELSKDLVGIEESAYELARSLDNGNSETAAGVLGLADQLEEIANHLHRFAGRAQLDPRGTEPAEAIAAASWGVERLCNQVGDFIARDARAIAVSLSAAPWPGR